MATQIWRVSGLIIVGVIWSDELALAQAQQRYFFAEAHLGTIVELTLYAPNEDVANEASRSAYARTKALDRIFSDYRSDSEAMRLCEHSGSGRQTVVSPELFQVLKRALEVSEQSDGAFDVTVGPLVKLWRRSRKVKMLPSHDEIAAAKQAVGWRYVMLNDETKTVVLQRPEMRLDFGGIAKGFIAQEMSRVLRDQGIRQTLVAVAGDIVAGDPPTNAAGWKVGVAPLERSGGASSRMLSLKNCAISTSGDAFQYSEIDGVRYSHIVDPETGLGLTRRSSVTVVAADGATSDALATAVCILGPERGLKMIEGHQNVEALIVQATDDGVETFESKGFRGYEIIPNESK
jgi:thiamine biosynthesis lipoprotein